MIDSPVQRDGKDKTRFNIEIWTEYRFWAKEANQRAVFEKAGIYAGYGILNNKCSHKNNGRYITYRIFYEAICHENFRKDNGKMA